MRIVLLLAVLGAVGVGALARLVPAWDADCSCNQCPDETSGRCTPLCSICVGDTPPVFLSATVAGWIPPNPAFLMAMPADELPLWLRAHDIFHVPKAVLS